MGEPERPVPACVLVRLTCAEAQSILVLMASDSFVKRPAALSATDKLRAALVTTGFDEAMDVEIECTREEARFLGHGRLA